MKPSVWVVIKDPGGMWGGLAVFRWLMKSGVAAKLFSNGAATKLLPEILFGNEEFTSADAGISANEELPGLMITSMCDKGGIGRDLTPKLRERGIPVFALQDAWGAYLYSSWADKTFRPTMVGVNDHIGRESVESAWPDYNGKRIAVTGYPALDRYAGFDFAAATQKVMDTLAIGTDKPLVLYAGDVERAGEGLAHFLSALKVTGERAYLIARPHPRMKTDAPGETAIWNAEIQKAKDEGFADILDAPAELAPHELIAASTVVVSNFSSMNVEAAALRKQNISVLYPELGAELYRKATGGKIKEFPLVSLRASAKAENEAELAGLLAKSYRNALGLVKAQEKAFRLDGKNTERTARAALTLI